MRQHVTSCKCNCYIPQVLQSSRCWKGANHIFSNPLSSFQKALVRQTEISEKHSFTFKDTLETNLKNWIRSNQLLYYFSPSIEANEADNAQSAVAVLVEINVFGDQENFPYETNKGSLTFLWTAIIKPSSVADSPPFRPLIIVGRHRDKGRNASTPTRRRCAYEIWVHWNS